jgi:hypothetical protein
MLSWRVRLSSSSLSGCVVVSSQLLLVAYKNSIAKTVWNYTVGFINEN